MKTFKSIFVILSLLFSSQAFSQEKIEIREDNVDMSMGNKPAYIVMIPQANMKDVLKSWTKKIKQNTKAKVEQNGAEHSIKGTLITEIYSDPINIYSAVIQVDSSVKLISLFEVDSIFFTPGVQDSHIDNERTYQGIKNFIYGFALEEYKNAVSDELKLEGNNLKNLANELEKLEKQNTNYHKTIASNELNIKNSESEIILLEKQHERHLNEVDLNRSNLSSASKDEEKGAKKILKESEKDKKSIENKLEKEKKRIIDYNSKISELTRLAEENLIAQVAKKEDIELQKGFVDKVTQKLSNIK